jgi:hypothetical protein
VRLDPVDGPVHPIADLRSARRIYQPTRVGIRQLLGPGRVPRADKDGADYDAYLELNRATFFLFRLEGNSGLDSRSKITAVCL